MYGLAIVFLDIVLNDVMSLLRQTIIVTNLLPTPITCSVSLVP